MKSRWIVMMAAFSTLPLTGCATYGPGPGPIAYDGYYDDYYGPIHDGYWGDGDVFYYRGRSHGAYVADSGHHFRHDMGSTTGRPDMSGHGPGAGVGAGAPGGGGGFHPMHGMGPGGGHGRGHH